VRIDLVVQGPAATRDDARRIAGVCNADSIVAIGDERLPAFRLEEPSAGWPAGMSETSARPLADAARAARLDLAWVPRERKLADVRVVSMDMDSTLITIECIDEIADLKGIKPQIAAITERAMRGELDFRASLVERVALLKGLPVAALQQVYDERLRLSPGAERMLAAFRAVGAKSLLVSGGFTFFTDRLKARLGLDHTLSNTFEVTNDRLTGRVLGDIVDADAKAAALRSLRASLPPGLAVAIGDGANDLPLFAEADVSVAYRAKPVVRGKATHALDFSGLDGAVNLFAR
jgi:phosphoserine phosphatase